MICFSRPLHVCCIGAGPGSEVLGLHEVLPKDTHWYLMDSCEQWSHSARLLLQNIPGIKFNYGAFDITARFHPAHVFKKVSLQCIDKKIYGIDSFFFVILTPKSLY